MLCACKYAVDCPCYSSESATCRNGGGSYCGAYRQREDAILSLAWKKSGELFAKFMPLLCFAVSV